jgi:hypothetical protein
MGRERPGARTSHAAFRTGSDSEISVRPNAGLGRKVQVKPLVAAQPMLDTRMLVGGAVVDDQMQVQFTGRLPVDAFQEVAEFLMPMQREVVPDDVAIERAQRREQRGVAIAPIVGGHRAAAAASRRQTRLVLVQSLSFAYFIDAHHQRFGERNQVKAGDMG